MLAWTVPPHVQLHVKREIRAILELSYVSLAHSWLYTLHIPRTKFLFWNWSFGMEAPSVGYRLNQCISSEFVFFVCTLKPVLFRIFSAFFYFKKQHTQYSFRLKYAIKGTLDIGYIQNIHCIIHIWILTFVFPFLNSQWCGNEGKGFFGQKQENWNGQIYANSFHAMVW